MDWREPINHSMNLEPSEQAVSRRKTDGSMVDAHVTSRRMPAMKPVGERSAGNPHAGFDERGGETDRYGDTAPLLDSTTRAGLVGALGRDRTFR